MEPVKKGTAISYRDCNRKYQPKGTAISYRVCNRTYQLTGTAISYRDCNRFINHRKFSRGRDFENRGSFPEKLDGLDSICKLCCMNREMTRNIQSRLQPPYQPTGTAISYRVCNRRINRNKFSRGRDFINRGSFLPLRAIFLIALCLIPLTAHAREAKETARIEHLISSVEKLSGAKFIRNGTEYEPKEAGEHLRMKLKKGGDKIKTAENFIDGIAAKSSVSGKPYQIRKPDGTLVTTSAYFYARLKEYDQANP